MLPGATTITTTTTTATTKTTVASPTTTTTSKTTTTTATSKTSSTTSKTTTSTTSTSSGSIPSGAITVGKNGVGKPWTGIHFILGSNIIYVYPGNYTEQIVISRSGIKIYGQTSNKLAYSSNTVTISRYMSAAMAGSNDLSGTVRVLATGVSLYNLNIENTYGKGAQAIALSVQAGTFGCYVCQLRGYQDTLLASRDTQFYGKCLITGATDFIFGLYGSIWITGGTIQTVASGYITASGLSSDDPNWYVIDKTTVTGTGTSYLGRPWRNYARVVFQNSNLGSIIPAAGWTQWSTATPNTDHILFGEYNNTGSGAWKSGRASFATQLTAPISITTVLNSTSWVDAAYL
ncbi:carbohydrate esterase family 8 protein [Tulasnella calospora MUT 4182]|uniref:Pectinesterase n=1 Tax=Tulasnella calospora MUT 4182 TaxID=1051891 RepID=A0A0C3Q229_9AGAM|nr:carbohydrate esterase family 8 protein [Tulasnella calospora MUT 4182]